MAFLRTSGESRSSFSHILNPVLTVVPALAVSIWMSLIVMPFAVAMRTSGSPTVRPLAVFIWMSGRSEYWF